MHNAMPTFPPRNMLLEAPDFFIITFYDKNNRKKMSLRIHFLSINNSHEKSCKLLLDLKILMEVHSGKVSW